MTALLISVLLSFLVAIAVSVYADLYRHRRDVALEVTGWLDETFVRLIDLRVQNEAAYEGKKPLLTQEEYRRNSQMLRSRLISGYMYNLIELTYGDNQELRQFSQLVERMLDMTRTLWKATETDWADVSKTTAALLEKEIPNKRTALEKLLINGARFSWNTFPTFILDTIRKIK